MRASCSSRRTGLKDVRELAELPGRDALAAGPNTSPAVITRVTAPDCRQSGVVGPVGDGLNVVSHSQAEIPALTPRWPKSRWPKWM